MAQALRQRGHTGPGDDGKRSLTSTKTSIQLGKHRAQVLRLDCQHYQVSAGGSLQVISHWRNPELSFQERTALGHRFAHRYIGGRSEIAGQHSMDDGLRHLAAADER